MHVRVTKLVQVDLKFERGTQDSSQAFSLSYKDSLIRGPGGMAVERAGTFLLRVVGMGSKAGTWSEEGREGERGSGPPRRR